MNVGRLIELLQRFDPSDKVILYADQEGLTTMEPESVSEQSDWSGNRVVLISAWEPTGNEPL